MTEEVKTEAEKGQEQMDAANLSAKKFTPTERSV